MADTTDRNSMHAPSMVKNRICSAVSLADTCTSLDQSRGNVNPQLFTEWTTGSYSSDARHAGTVELNGIKNESLEQKRYFDKADDEFDSGVKKYAQHPGTFELNGIKSESREQWHHYFDRVEDKFDSGVEKYVTSEGGGDFKFTNGVQHFSEREMDRSGSKGRSRRKPQYSLNKTELYDEAPETNPPNENVADFQTSGKFVSSSPDVDRNVSSLYIRRSMQKIKPEYVQVHQDSFPTEQEGGNNVQVPLNSTSVLEHGHEELVDVLSDYRSVHKENHEQHVLVPQNTSSSLEQNGDYVQDSKTSSSFHEQDSEKYLDVHQDTTCSDVEQDNGRYVRLHQDTGFVGQQDSDSEIQKNQFECKECLLTLCDFDLYTDHLMSHTASRHGNSSDNPSAHVPSMEAHAGNVVGQRLLSTQVSDSCSMESDDCLEIDLSPCKQELGKEKEGGEIETKMVEMMEGNPTGGGEMKRRRGRKKKETEIDPSLVRCPVCSKAFKTRNNLKTHLCKFHSENKTVLQEFFLKGESVKRKSVCALCGKCFISKTSLLRHLDTRHQGQAQARCGVCDEIFENTELLFKHTRVCHRHGNGDNQKPNTSEENSRSVVTKEKLDKNENHQTLSDDPYQNTTNRLLLDQIGATFPQEIQTSKVDPLMENTQINQSFERNHSSYVDSDQMDSDEGQVMPQTSHYFQREIDMPSSDSPKSRDIYCSMCLLFFDSVEKFVVHCMASSECLSSKECPVCGKVINSSLKEHLKSHSDDRPYQCEICKASFKRNHQMKLHKQTVHSDVRLYHCELCSKSFKRRDKLTCHYRTHSDEHPFMCTECGSVFKWKHHLKRHRDNVHADKATQVKARRFPCEVCGNCFKWRHHLKRHLRNVHHVIDDSLEGDDGKMEASFTGSESSLMAADCIRLGEGGPVEKDMTEDQT